MKHSLCWPVLVWALAGLARGQTPVPGSTTPAASPTPLVAAVTRPTYLPFGASYDQTKGWSPFAAVAVPIQNEVGIYEVTTARFDSQYIIDDGGHKRLSVSAHLTEDICKTILPAASRLQFLMCGGVGINLGGSGAAAAQAGATQTAPSNFLTEIAPVAVYQITPHWAAMVTVRTVFIPTSKPTAPGWWNAIPSAGMVYTR